MRVVIVLAQRADAVRRYIEDTGLPFNILIDESREVVKAYGVWHRIGLDAWNISRPAVFLIEPDRSISYSFVAESQEEFPTHAEILRAVTTNHEPNLEPRTVNPEP